MIRRLWASSVSFALTAVVAGSSPAGAEQAPCDPATGVCLLTAGPWLSPQHLRYAGPATLPDSLRVRWSQGRSSGNAAASTAPPEQDGVRIWSAKLPAGIHPGPLNLRARVRGSAVERVDEARVRPRAGPLGLTLRKRSGSFIAGLALSVRDRVQVSLRLRLIGRRPAGRRVLRSWTRVRTVAAGGRGLELSAEISRAQRLCVTYRACKLAASARVRALGYGLGRDTEGRRVAPLWRPALGAARRYARSREVPVSFSVIEPNGRQSGYRSTVTMPAASLTKPILMAAFLRRPSVRDRSLSASERDVVGRMIRVSDDPAAITVRQWAGSEAITGLVNEAGMRDSSFYGSIGFAGGLSRISARDQARFFHSIERYLPDRHRRFATDLLAGIAPSQRWGVAEARPGGWRLMFKGGWGIGDSSGPGTVDHQSALLRRGRCRIGLSILSEHNRSHDYGKTTLRGVAERLLKRASRVRC